MLTETLQAVNLEYFGGVFEVIAHENECVSVLLDEYTHWNYFHDSAGCWGGKHPWDGDIPWWANMRFGMLAAHKLGCKLKDEGVSGSWMPDIEKYPTFLSWMDKRHLREPWDAESLKRQENYILAMGKCFAQELALCPPVLKPFLGPLDWPSDAGGLTLASIDLTPAQT